MDGNEGAVEALQGFNIDPQIHKFPSENQCDNQSNNSILRADQTNDVEYKLEKNRQLARSLFRRPRGGSSSAAPTLSTTPTNDIFSGATASELPAAHPSVTDINKGNKSNAENEDLHIWLEERGLSKYLEIFQKAGATISLLPYLTDEDLKQMGIIALGARKKVIVGAASLKAELAGPTKMGQARTAAPVADVSMEGTYNIAAYFPSDSVHPPAAAAGTIHRFLNRPPGAQPALLPLKRPLKSAANAPTKKSAFAKSGWAHDAARGDERGKKWKGGARAGTSVPFRPWQLVAGCPSFVVDRFCNLPATPQSKHWFLTHFHADHYKGLTSKFNRGMIYCTPITAALIHQQLRVPKSCITEVKVGQPTTIEGVKVTFIDANHCPGACMILFEPQGRLPVLHSGDCRLTEQMQKEPVLQAVRGKVDLVLDTTYASPEYTFPPQDEVINFVLDAVKAEAFNPKTLFMFGSYTIGKERLFLEVAKTLKTPIYASATKHKILNCLDLDEETRKLLTTDDSKSNLHVVPMWMVTQKHMANVLRHYRGQFTTVVGFQPTGWTHQRDAEQTKKRGRRKQKGTLVTYQVPYSEHSSFTELKNFVAWLQPRQIIPSVNSDIGGPKSQRLVALVRGHITS